LQGKVGNKWSEVAKHIPGRTGQQCAQRWRHKVSLAWPLAVNSSAWKKDCTPCESFGHSILNNPSYPRHVQVNPNIRRDKWTSDEDAKLIELVKTFGVGRWAEIARNCDGRTDQQCMGRWRRHLDPSIRRVRQQHGFLVCAAVRRCVTGALQTHHPAQARPACITFCWPSKHVAAQPMLMEKSSRTAAVALLLF
jgi:myb proto-oncogene protein